VAGAGGDADLPAPFTAVRNEQAAEVWARLRGTATRQVLERAVLTLMDGELDE
jgi:hypothetical protein